MGTIGVLRIREVLPANAANLGGIADPFAGENFAHLAAGITRLIEQGERLEALGAKLARGVQWADAQVPLALVADNEQGLAVARDDQDRLFIPWIEIGQVRQI